MKLPKELYDEIIRHTKESYPNEACGLLSYVDDLFIKIYRMENMSDSPSRHFRMDGTEQWEKYVEINEKGASPCVYHSHPSGDAKLSVFDYSVVGSTSDLWLIVGYPDKLALWQQGLKVDLEVI